MSIATELRNIVAGLINEYGEQCMLRRTTVTDDPATGSPSATHANYSFRSVMIRKGSATSNDPSAAVLRQFSGGGRVLQGDEEWLIAALHLALEPLPSDLFIQGSAETAAGRRRILDRETYRVEGQDIAYRVGVSV